jgi:anti-sigma factor RsiW
MRAKLGPLVEAFTGFFTDQHAFLLAKMLARVDALDADLAELDAKLAALIAPFADAAWPTREPPGRQGSRSSARVLVGWLGSTRTSRCSPGPRRCVLGRLPAWPDHGAGQGSGDHAAWSLGW